MKVENKSGQFAKGETNCRRAINLSLRGEMTVQFEAINPRTQELNFNKVRFQRKGGKVTNLIAGAQAGPRGGGGEGDAPLQ